MNKTVHFEKDSRTLHVRSRPLLQWLVFILSLWPVLVRHLGSLPGALSYTKYFADGIVLLVLITLACRRHLSFKRPAMPLLAVVCVFFVYTLLVYAFRFQSPFYFLWGFRNNFRFYIAFFAFITFMDETDVSSWFKLLDTLFWLNIALSVFQFTFMGVRQDYLGGVFGIEGGSNGYTLLFFSVVVGRSALCAFAGREKMSVCVWKGIASLVVAAMAEMKFYFVVFILLLGMASVFSRLSLKKFLALLIGALAMMGCSTLLVAWFGSESMLTIKGLIELATKQSYSTARDLNRLSAIPTLANTIVSQPADQIFGLGLGNCDTSAFAICNTPFYQRYSYLHYTWFTAAMLFLETGYVGLVIYALFFVLVFRHAFRQLKAGSCDAIFCQLAMMMTVLSGIVLFYNSSLRIESAYMLYFVFAVPFICKKKQPAGKRKEEAAT